MFRHEQYNRFQKFKVLCHSGKIETILEGKDFPSPVEWVIYPSNVCGYSCGHCIMAKEQTDHKNMLSEDAMNRVPDDASKHGIRCVIFSGGGDPLLNRFTLRTARRLQDYGIKTGINNQGFLLDGEVPFNYVRFSVDAATRETYRDIHNVDGFEKVSRNIAHVANLKAKEKGIELGMAFLITPLNWKETYLFCEWAQEFQPDFVHVRPAFLSADYLDRQYPGGDKKLKDEIMPYLNEAKAEIEKRFPNVWFRTDKFEGFWTKKLYSKCRATPLMAVTSGDGAFLICQDRGIMAEENYLRWGNYNNQSFEEIWWSEDHRKAIENIDLDRCPRCVENGYNEIIEHVFVEDNMKLDLL